MWRLRNLNKLRNRIFKIIFSIQINHILLIQKCKIVFFTKLFIHAENQFVNIYNFKRKLRFFERFGNIASQFEISSVYAVKFVQKLNRLHSSKIPLLCSPYYASSKDVGAVYEFYVTDHLQPELLKTFGPVAGETSVTNTIGLWPINPEEETH